MRMKLSEELAARGFVYQHTGESVAEVFDGASRTIYHGIDPSADSAHVGNMVIWMLLRHLVQAGHKVVFLIGGGTGMIGDPKPDAERDLADESVVVDRVLRLTAQAERLVGGGEQAITFVNNKDWLGSVSLLHFLRDIGKHFTVNELMKKDAIANRLRSDVGISYTEFAYPLLQAYDYLTLYRQYGCDVQVGGADQWGNIVSGVELVRRVEQQTVHAFTVPLITDKATGKKFGKSEGNAVWLDPVKTTPYEFYQFWFNVSDENVEDYLKVFTVLPLDEITDIIQVWEKDPASRSAQQHLAYTVTAYVHGTDTAQQVQNASTCVFGGSTVANLSPEEVELVKTQLPFQSVSADTTIVDVVVIAGLATSKREARTFMESGAITIDGSKCLNGSLLVGVYKQATPYVLLKRGKKQYALVEVTD